MSSYEIRKINEHLTLVHGLELWILDTGSPASFGAKSELSIEGDLYPIPPSYMGFGSEKLSEALGEKVTGLIGGDILGNYDTEWNLVDGTLQVSKHEANAVGIEIPLGFFMGVPTLTLNVNGEEQKWFFDTGAVISYAAEQSDLWGDPTDSFDDFYPGFGEFSTDVFDVEILLLGKPQTIKCGVLPTLLGMSLAMGGCSGILGLQALDLGSFVYAPRRKKLIKNA